MKTKSLKYFISLLFCCLMLFACFCFMPQNVSASALPSVAIKEGTNLISDSVSFNYPQDNKGSEQILCVNNFSFQEGDSVVYSYIKQDTDSIMYTTLKSVNYENVDGKSYCECPINFFGLAGSGVYNIKAVIVRNNQIIEKPSDLVITIKALNGNDGTWSGKISYNKISVWGNEYSKYNFSVELLKNKKAVDISNYEVDWYYSINNKKHYFGTGENVEWTPSQNGSYTIEANINLGLSNQSLPVTFDITNVTKNYTLYAIIALVSLGVGLTVLVIITTVRKVKKERVW